MLRLTKYSVRQNDRILKADVEAWLPWDCLSQIDRDVAVTLRVYAAVVGEDNDYPRQQQRAAIWIVRVNVSAPARPSCQAKEVDQVHPRQKRMQSLYRTRCAIFQVKFQLPSSSRFDMRASLAKKTKKLRSTVRRTLAAVLCPTKGFHAPNAIASCNANCNGGLDRVPSRIHCHSSLAFIIFELLRTRLADECGLRRLQRAG